VIRFNCPNCERVYELPDALARLPLVCKQCGQRITPPEPTPEPAPLPPPPKPAVIPVAPPKAAPVSVPKAPAAKPSAPPPSPKPATPVPVTSADGKDKRVAKPEAAANLEFNFSEPTAASSNETSRVKAVLPKDAPVQASAEPASDINLDLLPPAPPPAAPKPVQPPAPDAPPPPAKPVPTMLPFIADLVVFLALLAGGAFLGELIVRKPTGQIISESGAAPTFPPTELLLWAAPPVVFGLIYLMLGRRGRTVGEWIRRQRGEP